MLIDGVILEEGPMNPPHAQTLGLVEEAIRVAFGAGWRFRSRSPLVLGLDLDAAKQKLKDLGVEILGPRSVSQTDHTRFDSVGVPAFQFIQERLEYNSRTHHSNMDFYDRVQADDMKQMATVAAVFVWQTANRDTLLPGKPR